MNEKTSLWQPLIKPAFLQDINRLPAKDVSQIMDKVTALTIDPSPDGKTKKQLTHCPGRPYRIRSGRYRIFYTYNKDYVHIYRIDIRDESTYRDFLGAEEIPSPDGLQGLEIPDEIEIEPSWVTTVPQSSGEASFSEAESRALPEPISVALLNMLQIPKQYHGSLLQISDENALLLCADVDQKILIQLIDYLFPSHLLQVMQQPDLVLNEVNDLQRYKDGELLAFLLKLSPEQEKYVRWPLNANGPALVKGGPGTGKSTVALYRVRSLLQQLQQKGQAAPRILFTTYTNALIKFSEQLLQQLLGDASSQVRVYTADTVADDILQHVGQTKGILSPEEAMGLLRQAMADTPLEGSVLQQESQRLTLKKMGLEYLLQEIGSIIVARQVKTVDDYQQMTRAGRKLGLNASQRRIVWRVYERWLTLQLATGKETWAQRRARAASLVEQTPFLASYDAVVIEEAQDLDPTVLSILVKLCKIPNRLFVTADANQAIYNNGFHWADAHPYLKFHGRINVLRENYRSTREIGDAAQSYLVSGGQEVEANETSSYVNNGPKPHVLAVQSRAHEAQLLANFFKNTMSSQGLTLASCVVLCPNEPAGKGIVAALSELQLQARYMTGRDLDLSYPGIKVLMLNVAKGLEFPIVALAGFISSIYPAIPSAASSEERAEIMGRERRTMYVGMTRAMRALLVVTPVTIDTPLLHGFDPLYWNLDRKI